MVTIRHKQQDEKKQTTSSVLQQLNGTRDPELSQNAVVSHVKVDYISCPSLKLAINLLKSEEKKDQKSSAQFFTELDNKYSFTCISEDPEQPAPMSIYIQVGHGCDLHFLPQLPENKKPYGNCYIIIENQLYYIRPDGTQENITITGFPPFLDSLKQLNPSNAKTMHLSQDQISSLITSYCGHTIETDHLFYEILDKDATISHSGIIEWEELPETFPHSMREIVDNADKTLPLILARTPVGSPVTLSIDNIISLLHEFDQYIHDKKEKEFELVKILSPDYFEEADRLVKADILVVEQAKAYLIQSVARQLKAESVLQRAAPIKHSENLISNTFWRWAVFAALMIVEFVPMLAMNVMYAGDSMASLSPYLFFISPHVMTAIGVLCALNMIAGTICFNGSTIMKQLRIRYYGNTPTLFSVYGQQIEAANEIDKLLLMDNDLSSRTYAEYRKFSKYVSEKNIPSQAKKDSLTAILSTSFMTALAGIAALSGQVFMGSVLLGLILGAITFSTLTPLILTAFVMSHLWSVFIVSLPLAICQCAMSYFLRVTSASRLFDLDKDEREAVEKNRVAYNNEKTSTQQKLTHSYQKKMEQESTHKMLLEESPRYISEKVPFLSEIKGFDKSRLLNKEKSHNKWLQTQVKDRVKLQIRKHYPKEIFENNYYPKEIFKNKMVMMPRKYLTEINPDLKNKLKPVKMDSKNRR